MGTAKPVWCSPLPAPATLIPMVWPDRLTSGPPVSSPGHDPVGGHQQAGESLAARGHRARAGW